MDIVIPLRFKAGKFKLDELNGGDESLTLCFDEKWELVSYSVPEYENEVRIYTVPRELMPSALSAVYGDNGGLERVELAEGDKTRLIYIRFSDNELAKSGVLNFVEEQADKIADEVIGRGQKLARLFVGRFYDGEAVELAVKTATAEEVQAVIDEYDEEAEEYDEDAEADEYDEDTDEFDEDIEAADYSGDYPAQNLIMADCETLGVMLMCTGGDFQSELFELAAAAFEERIKSRVLNKIDKTEDFKFISEEND